MARTRVPVALGFYKDESWTISSRDCLNFFPHIPESATITDAALYGMSGIELAAIAGAGATNRGGHVMNGVPYVVNGDKLYTITYSEDINGNRTYGATDISGIVQLFGSDRVFMADNGQELIIVAPDYNNQFNAWIYTVDGGLVQISDPDFDGPVLSVAFSDGYFAFPKKDSNKWFISDLRQGASYIATDFASAESDPDNINVLSPLRGLVYVFGSQTMEPYQNVGGAGFPYERVNSGIYKKGCYAASSVVEVNENLVWIGGGKNEQPAIWMSDGGQPAKLSPHSIDVLIFSGGMEKIRDAYAIKWAERGHSFVAFTVPDVCTVVYDFASQLWHVRNSTIITANPQYLPWRVSAILDAYSELIVADTLTSNIGIYSSNYFTEYGEEIRGSFTSIPIDNDGKPFSIYGVELLVQTGDVPLSGQGSEPYIRLSVSKDGGRTFLPEMPKLMGMTGNYLYRVAWGGLGRFSRSAVLKWDISEPIKRVIVKGEVEIGS